MRRRRFRKWAKWACTVAGGAAVGLAVLSGLCAWIIDHTSSDRTGFWCVWAKDGLVVFLKVEEPSPVLVPNRWRRSFDWSPGWRWGTARESPGNGWAAGVLFARRNVPPPSELHVGTNI